MNGIVFLIITILLIPATIFLRTYHLLYSVDEKTQFYIDKSISINILYAVIIIFIIFCFITLLLNYKKKIPYNILVKGRYSVIGVTGLLTIMFIAVGGVNLVTTFLSSKIEIKGVLLGVLYILSGVSFLFQTFYVMDGKFPKLLPAFAWCPVILIFLRTITPFMQHTKVNAVSEYVLNIIFYCALSLFFLYYTFFTLGRKNIYSVIAFGNISMVFGGVSIVAPIIASCMGSKNVVEVFSLEKTLDVAIVLFIVVITFSLSVSVGKFNKKPGLIYDYLPEENSGGDDIKNPVAAVGLSKDEIIGSDAVSDGPDDTEDNDGDEQSDLQSDVAETESDSIFSQLEKFQKENDEEYKNE